MTKRPPGGRHLGLMRIGVALAVFLQLFTAPIASALTTEVTLLSQDFASYNGVDANAPAGWAFTNIGYYTSDSSSGVAPNSLQFNSSTSTATGTYTLAADQTSKTISFWIKGNSVGTSGSTLSVDQSSDGLTWTPVASYAGASIPSVGANVVEDLLPATTSIRFVYTKVSGNVALDDVVVSGQEVDEPPTQPEANPPAGTYNSPKSVMLSSNDDSDLPTEIYYTTDGSDPNTSLTRKSYTTTGPILVNANMTIKAIAYDAVGNSSVPAEFPYVIDQEAPRIESEQYFSGGTLISNDTPTNKNVTVRITASEPSNITSDPNNGWVRLNDVTFEKEYTQNTAESVSVTDIAGNESAPRDIEVRGTNREDPTITINDMLENGVYVGPTDYIVQDDLGDAAIQSVTINGIAAPVRGTISNTGDYTIVATDTAGNQAEVTIVVAIPVFMPTLPVQPTLTLEPLSPRSLVSTQNIETSEVASSTNSGATSRGDRVQASAPNLIDATPGKDIALSPSGEGWKLWGIAWYWYGAVASLLGSGGWLLGRRYFTADNEEF